MMVPTISDEYQMLECALRQKYHSSFWLPSSFQPVRTADTTATSIPYWQSQWSDRSGGPKRTHQTHGNAKPNLFHFPHVEVPRDDPGEDCEDEVHDNVVHIAAFFEVVSELRIEAKVEAVPDVVGWLPADLSPLKDNLGDHVCIHAADDEPQYPMAPFLCQLEQSDSKSSFRKRLVY